MHKIISSRVPLLLNRVLMVAFIAGLLYTLLVDIPKRQIGDRDSLTAEQKNRIDAENSSRDIIIKAIGGGLLFVTAGVSFLNYKATEKNVQLSQEKNEAERFVKATEMMSKWQQEHYTALGGMYALKNLGLTNLDYLKPSIDVLCAFIRDLARRYSDVEIEFSTKYTERLSYELSGREDEDFEPIQRRVFRDCLHELTRERDSKAPNAALKVLSQLLSGEDDYGLMGVSGRVPLDNIDLSEFELGGLCFCTSSLKYSKLMCVNGFALDLHGSILSYADFSFSNLPLANLSGTIATHTNFEGVQLTGALLYDADLSLARNLKQAQINEAIGSRKTKLPPGLSRPSHWDVNTPNDLAIRFRFTDYMRRCADKKQTQGFIEAARESFFAPLPLPILLQPVLKSKKGTNDAPNRT